MPIRIDARVFSLTVFGLLSGCAQSPAVTPVFEDEAFENDKFYNLLVVGIAGNYTNRAQFERTLVSELRGKRVYATAYHTVAPGNDAISREALVRAIDTNGFDAVLITRVLDRSESIEVSQGTSTAQATTIGGSALNLFRYDYEELNEPGTVDLNVDVRLGTELFSAEEGTIVWSIQLDSQRAENTGLLIDQMSSAIVNAVDRAGYLGR